MIWESNHNDVKVATAYFNEVFQSLAKLMVTQNPCHCG